MVDIAAYARIFAAIPDDDLVGKRTSAVKDIGAKIVKGNQTAVLLQYANDIALAADASAGPPAALLSEVQASVRKTAVAFVAEEAQLESTVCALMAALQVIEGGKPSRNVLTSVDLFAVGLWSALGFQPARKEAKLEELRAAVVVRAQALIASSAEAGRLRHPVPDVNAAPPATLDSASVATTVNDSTSPTVDALRYNAQIDREEIDLLWWVIGDRSRLLNQRFSTAPNRVAAALAAGLETGEIVRRVPGAAHRNLAQRQGGAADEAYTLKELLQALGDDHLKLAASFSGSSQVDGYPAVFPLLHALRAGKGSDSRSRLKRSLAEWTERALLERAILGVVSTLSAAGK